MDFLSIVITFQFDVWIISLNIKNILFAIYVDSCLIQDIDELFNFVKIGAFLLSKKNGFQFLNISCIAITFYQIMQIVERNYSFNTS